MQAQQLIRDGRRYGWNVKTARYLTEDKILLEFEKPFPNKDYHVYVLVDSEGQVLKSYNFFQREIPLDLRAWDAHVK